MLDKRGLTSSGFTAGSKQLPTLQYVIIIIIIIIIIVSLFRLTNRNHNNGCHAGQHKLARRPEQQGLARANAATNGAKQSRQPQPGRDLVGIHQMSPLEHTSDKQAYYSFIDPEG